ncbi:nucleoside diphosphate kinase, mitochondrial isoform X4 [Macaca fascicularis]|uniref:nucleoside diphosphate kinase, mitochondrial isoform X4 n=1 Tax=Macaca fascicularis TaxID=9541 RepID=UPI003D15D631
MKMLQAPESVLAEHYQDLRRKPFYPALIRYMSSGPMVAMVWEGYNVVRASRAMIGHTDSAEAAPGTIRGDFSVHISSHRLAPLDRGQQGSNRWSLGLLRVHMKPEPHLAPVTGTGTSSTPATLWRGPSGRSSCGSRAVSW